MPSVEAEVAGLDRELEVVLLRCAQEGLANVRKHARASTVSIAVAWNDGQVVLDVRDDGVGPGTAVPGEGGFGLAGMRDRVALVGGRIEFGAGDGGGTVLRVVVPRADVAADADAATRADTETTGADA